MNISASFNFCFRSALRGILILSGIVIALIALSTIGCIVFDNFNVNYTGSYEMCAMIFVFVYACGAIRSGLRLANQCGRSRVSAFFAILLALIATSAVCAVTCQLLSTIASLVGRNLEGFGFASIWTTTYFGDFAPVHTLTFGEHIASIFGNFGVFTAASMCGVFCSALFYKIPSKWTAIAGIAFGVFIMMGIPTILSSLVLLANISEAFGAFLDVLVHLIFDTPVNLAVSALIGAAIVAGINYLLVRRVAVKAAGEKG